MHLVDPVVLGTAGLAAARFLNLPIVSSYHTNLAAYCGHFGFPIFTRPMWSYNRFIHNQCALTFCPSPSIAAMLSIQGFEHVRLWPRGVDTDLFRPSRRSPELRAAWLQSRNEEGKRADDTAILLYAGRISWEKNLNLLIQACRSMHTSRCHLVIVGDGPALKDAQRDLADLPVTFTGYLTGEQLATAYASADIFAFPSTSETFGQVVLEAMASALPVVGVHSEGVCDLVQRERTGYLLDATNATTMPEQAQAYRALLEYLVDQADVRRAMGQAGMLEARQRSWPAAMQRLLDGYHEVIEAARPLVAA